MAGDGSSWRVGVNRYEGLFVGAGALRRIMRRDLVGGDGFMVVEVYERDVANFGARRQSGPGMDEKGEMALAAAGAVRRRKETDSWLGREVGLRVNRAEGAEDLSR